MKKAIITFTGFTESNDERTGTRDLYLDVVKKFSGEKVSVYEPREWTSNVKTLADEINRQGISACAVISYSHGQAAACDFARECYKQGIAIRLWLACDPVYRPTWLWRKNWTQVAAFRALIPKSARISVPSNIERVAGVRQNISIPSGHDLKTSLGTKLEPLAFLPYCHTQIDLSPEWFGLVDKELSNLLNP